MSVCGHSRTIIPNSVFAYIGQTGSPSPIFERRHALLRNLRKLDSWPPETREKEGLLELDVGNQGNRPKVTQVFCQCRGKYDQVTVYI